MTTTTTTKAILNLTQHAATADQVAAGVYEPKNKKDVQAALTFDEQPTQVELEMAAFRIACMAKEEGATVAMIGGAPFFMAPLEDALKSAGIKPVYAFSKREAADMPQPDGSVQKTQVFRHVGFIGL